ncbi:MAG TPA: hypothetical protein VK668_13055 [Mucilaginibacter sp.]|nr:hypothetical protein [Mucilaginibacter sp.]
MTDRNKKVFLTLCITVPFLAYCIYYYSHMIKNAPYKFTEFDSISFQYGPGDSLVNKYNSKTGEYQYVNTRDSIVKMKLHLTREDLLYLHRKAADLGFWDFPSMELGSTAIKHNGAKPLRYVIEFKYKRKSKKVTFDESFNGDPKLIDANIQVIKEIQKVLQDEEGKQGN